MSLVIRRIPEPKQLIHPTGHINHRPLMRESVEAITTVVSTSAGTPYAAKGRVGDAGVDHDVVYCYAARVGLREDCVGDVRYGINVTDQQARDGG